MYLLFIIHVIIYVHEYAYNVYATDFFPSWILFELFEKAPPVAERE